MKNPYEVLGCSSKHSREDITRIYKKLAMKYHPDKNIKKTSEYRTESEQRFKEITCAYQYLKRNDFKYSTFDNSDYNEFSYHYFTRNMMKNGLDFSNIFTKINRFKNMDFNKMTDNVLKEVETMTEIYNDHSGILEKTEDIFVNANLDLFDIYNNVKKDITLTLTRKCEKCYGRGYDVDRKSPQDKCLYCNGNKTIEKKELFTFFSMMKNVCFHKRSNYETGRSQGDIHINLFPKKHDLYSITNYYDIVYRHKINLVDLSDHDKQNKRSFQFKYLDICEYTVEITNPYYFYEYNIEEKGLYIPNKNRGNLKIILIPPDNLDISIKIKNTKDTTTIKITEN